MLLFLNLQARFLHNKPKPGSESGISGRDTLTVHLWWSLDSWCRTTELLTPTLLISLSHVVTHTLTHAHTNAQFAAIG